MKFTMPLAVPGIHLNGVGTRLDEVRQTLAARDIAQVGRQRISELGHGVQSLGHDVQSLGHELRQVRLTTAPQPKGRDLLPGIALAAGVSVGLGAGLALMYFFDPGRGRDRRMSLRDRLMRWARVRRAAPGEPVEGFGNRTVAVMDEPRETFRRDEQELVPEGIRVPIG